MTQDAAAAESGQEAGGYRYDVFLCHNRLEKPLVKDIADALQIEAGTLFFLDEYSIPPSVEFDRYIREEMERSACCAICLGPAGWGPTQIREARQALNIRSRRPSYRIIPVKLPGCRDEDWGQVFGVGELPPFNWVDFQTPTDDEARQRLIEAIQGNFQPKASGPEEVTAYYIRRQAALWDRAQRNDNSLLLRGRLLKEVQRQAADNPSYIMVNAVPAFLNRCADAERNRLRIGLSVAISTMVVTTVLAVIAYQQRNAALHQARVAQARSLAAIAPYVVGEQRQDERAALLARWSYLIDESEGAVSSFLVGASLTQVLGLPYFGSTYLPDRPFRPARVSDSGAYFLAEDDRLLVGPVVSAEGRRAAERFVDLPDTIGLAVFSERGDSLLIATKAGDLERIDVNDPRAVTPLASLGGVPEIMAQSSDGIHVVASFPGGKMVAVDLAQRQTRTWQLPTAVESLAVSEKGDHVAVVFEDDSQLQVFAVGANQPRAIYSSDVGVDSYDFAPNGQSIVIGLHNGAVIKWSYDTDERIRFTAIETGSINTIAVAPGGEMVAAASGSIAPGIQIWRLGQEQSSPTVIPGVRGVRTLRFTRDGRFLISATLQGGIRYWRLNGTGVQRKADPRDFQPFPLPARLYSIVRIPGTNEFLIGGDHGKLQLWPSADLLGQPRVLEAERMAALQAVPDQDLYVSKGRNFLLTSHVMAVALARDIKRFAAVDPYGFVTVWDFQNGIDRARLIPTVDSTAPTMSLALSPSGRWMVVGTNSTVTTLHELTDVGESKRSIRLSMPGTEAVRAVRFLDDTRVLVGDDTGRLTLWRTAPSLESRVLFESGPPVMSIATYVGDKMIVGRGQQVDLIDVTAGQVLATLGEGLGAVYSVAVSDDRASIAVGYLDGTIRLWQTATLTQSPTTLQESGSVVRSLAFDSTGERLLSVSDDGLVRSQVLDRHRLAKIVCEVSWRDITDDERRLFLGNDNDGQKVCR